MIKLTRIKRFLKNRFKPLPPCPEKPAELKGETASFDCGVAVVYVGNGAGKQHYDTVFSEKGAKFKTFEGLGGKADICAILYIDKGACIPAIVNGFEHDEADFAGFTLRKKIDGIWNWMCNDDSWHAISPEMPDKRVFAEGDVPVIPDRDIEGVLIFDAVWKLSDGTQADCGYRMFNNSLMAHALGAMDGKAYHNTMAAYENAMTKGYKYYEVDLSMTVDGRMVLCHGWTESNCTHTGFEYSDDLDKTMTYKKLMSLKVHGNPQIDLRSFYREMKKHADHLYEFDMHSIKGKRAVEIIKETIRDCKCDREVLDRVLMQVYTNKMYRAVDQTYHFKYYQYLIGKPEKNFYEKLPILIDEGICAAAIHVKKVCPEYINALRNAGIYVLAFTVTDDAEQAQHLLDMGVNTICTDYVAPSDLETVAAAR